MSILHQRLNKRVPRISGVLIKILITKALILLHCAVISQCAAWDFMSLYAAYMSLIRLVVRRRLSG